MCSTCTRLYIAGKKKWVHESIADQQWLERGNFFHIFSQCVEETKLANYEGRRKAGRQDFQFDKI